ncbi:MAG: hypothetical protein GQ564_00885 [Bacteroidales bacterium]|nr:hypothetical protein [Bacteroidales bacterium]
MKESVILVCGILLFNFHLFSNENDKYIEKQIANIDKLLSKGKFANGIIYTKKDTVEMRLLTFKRKVKMNCHLFCIGKSEKDSIKILKANEILGYKVLGEEYISHKSKEGVFFIKKLETGKVVLYEKPAIPSDTRLLYYLKFPNYYNYVIINPTKNNITEYNMPNTRPSSSSDIIETHIKSNGINDAFKIFVKNYLGDCEKATNMVRAGFYTIQDIPDVIRTYNSCF